MAIDAGGIQIAVALTAACRTPVANLGILCRNSDTAILVMKASEPRHSRFHPSRGGEVGRVISAERVQEPNHRHRRLLRPRRERPHRCAAEQRDELAPLHSITSSARASTDDGISSPSALAVLRLTTSSYLVGACTGRSAWLLSLKDAVDVAGRAAVRIDRTRSVGDQAAADNEEAIRVHRDQPVPGHQRDDALTMKYGKPASRHNQAATRPARNCRNGTFNFVWVAHANRPQLHSE